MASAAGRRGDTRREPAFSEAYELERSMLEGLLNISLADRTQDVDFLKSYRSKLAKKTRKVEATGVRLCQLRVGRHNDIVPLERDLAVMRGRSEVKRTEVDGLLVRMGVCG